MKKRILPLFILFTALMLLFALSATAVELRINGSLVVFNDITGTPFIDAANRTQVPLRQAMEAFGAKVSWDAVYRQAIVSKNGTTVVVPIDYYHIYINDVQKDTDTAAMIVGNRTYLPIRAVAEAFGAQVSWDGKAVQLVIPEGLASYTLPQAQSIALLHAKLSFSEVCFQEGSLLYEDAWVFRFIFNDTDNLYACEIDAKTGAVTSFDVSELPLDITITEEGMLLSRDDIFALAISYAGLEYSSDVSMTSVTVETDGISVLYVVTITAEGFTYVLEINADTKEVRQLEMYYTTDEEGEAASEEADISYDTFHDTGFTDESQNDIDENSDLTFDGSDIPDTETSYDSDDTEDDDSLYSGGSLELYEGDENFNYGNDYSSEDDYDESDYELIYGSDSENAYDYDYDSDDDYDYDSGYDSGYDSSYDSDDSGNGYTVDYDY